MPIYPGAGAPLTDYAKDNLNTRYPRGLHRQMAGSCSDVLMVREVAMMMLMEKITDKLDWQNKVFDEATWAGYANEAMDWPVDDIYRDIWLDRGDYLPRQLQSIFNEKTLDYCLHESQAKARYFKESGIIPTLEATYSMAKSDVLVNRVLHDELRAALDRLRTDQAANPGWYPQTFEAVKLLIDPSLYPLVYGQSRFIEDEILGIDDVIDKWAGKGDVLPIPAFQRPTYRWDPPLDSWWSDTYQWLPSNIRFKEDSGVEFTSYINNLHPGDYRDVYHTVEKLIEKALPMWDQCLPLLLKRGRIGVGRLSKRFPVPFNLSDEHGANWDKTRPELPDSKTWDEGSRLIWEEWVSERQPILPDIGDNFPISSDYIPPDRRRLQNLFKDQGLQVIVKMTSIELDPTNPQSPPDDWHVEGLMNEHIVATALYYVESENVTPSHLSFRMLTDGTQTGQSFDRHHQDSFRWLEAIYGTLFSYGLNSCLQNYGKVDIRKGRLLAFPNVFQHRVSPFELVDATKPGRQSFITILLVDPLTRIISTANVPPQREDWFFERAFQPVPTAGPNMKESTAAAIPLEPGQIPLSHDSDEGKLDQDIATFQTTRLPPELLEMVWKEMRDDFLMTEERAKEHRLKMLEERSRLHQTARDGWEGMNYAFCEHSIAAYFDM